MGYKNSRPSGERVRQGCLVTSARGAGGWRGARAPRLSCYLASGSQGRRQGCLVRAVVVAAAATLGRDRDDHVGRAHGPTLILRRGQAGSVGDVEHVAEPAEHSLPHQGFDRLEGVATDHEHALRHDFGVEHVLRQFEHLAPRAFLDVLPLLGPPDGVGCEAARPRSARLHAVAAVGAGQDRPVSRPLELGIADHQLEREGDLVSVRDQDVLGSPFEVIVELRLVAAVDRGDLPIVPAQEFDELLHLDDVRVGVVEEEHLARLVGERASGYHLPHHPYHRATGCVSRTLHDLPLT